MLTHPGPDLVIGPDRPTKGNGYARFERRLPVLTNKDPNMVVSLSWAAINAWDRVNSSLKDMAVVMKQLDGADEAIELIKSFRHLYPYDSRESIENVLVELYKVKWASGEHESSRRVKSELLVQVNNSLTCEDGHREIVMVLAATNFSWDIDEAPRLVRCLLSRKELIRINLKTIEILDQSKSFFELLLLGYTSPCHLAVARQWDVWKGSNAPESPSCFGVCFHSLILPSGVVVTKVATDVDIDEVARRTEGYSEDALTNVCRDASLNGMSAVFPKQIWRSMGSGSRNLDQPKGDATHLMMKTTADCMLVAEVG
ncbi:hypothetical protein POTOM_054494 [Populus tomentosa]|uniref:Uncharacterized protein n=1 Tax=Populus tomentosa TaxID=118781 RepID=A0A8X8BYK3_POPTO|nr:hypothetical protein POTOM_054494 [Populus tomentosa]